MPRRFLAVLLLLASGCLNTGRTSSENAAALLQASPQRLSLEDFQAFFSNRVEAAADVIIEMNLSPAISRNAIFWKMRVIPLSRTMLDRVDPQATYMNLWLLSESMLRYLQEGQGENVFGAAKPTAVATAQKLVEAARNLGPRILNPAQLAKAKKVVEGQATTIGLGQALSPAQVNAWSGAISKVLGKSVDYVRAPLVAFNPAGSLSDTATAVERVAIVARLLNRQAASLPREMRWSIQLLELELLENAEVSSVIDSFGKVSDSSTVLAHTVGELPTQLRDEWSQLLSDFDSRQAGLQEMLDRVNTIVTSTDQTGKSLTEMGEVWTKLVATFTKTLEGLEKPSAEPAKEKGPPFDINDYRRTADELTKTAAALSELLAQVQQLTSPEEASSLTRILDSAVRRTLLSLGLFVVFVALVMLGYRWTVRRVT